MPPHRVNAYFNDSAYAALEEVAALRGMSLSDVLRDAISVYRWFVVTRTQGGRILVERPDGSTREVISV